MSKKFKLNVAKKHGSRIIKSIHTVDLICRYAVHCILGCFRLVYSGIRIYSGSSASGSRIISGMEKCLLGVDKSVLLSLRMFSQKSSKAELPRYLLGF